MDMTTIAGLITGIIVVTLAIMTGSDLSIFINLPGFLIVVGGTFAATLVKFPLTTVWTALTVGLRAVFVNEADDPRLLINQAIKFVKLVRSEGVKALEKVPVQNSFFKKGIQLCADGNDKEFTQEMLTREMNLTIQRQEISAKVFSAIGESAPAFGMFGTIVGLVQMLSQMEDPSKIGQGMAIALLTTLYGVLIAQIAALPMSAKLLAKAHQERDNRSLIIESLKHIHDRTNPSMMLDSLESYLPEKQRLGDAKGRHPRRRATDWK